MPFPLGLEVGVNEEAFFFLLKGINVLRVSSLIGFSIFILSPRPTNPKVIRMITIS